MGNTPYEWCVGGSIRATYLRRDVNGESDEIHMVLCNRSEWSGNGSQKVGNTCKSCCEGISIDRVTLGGRLHERLKLIKCTAHSSKERRRPLFCQPFSAVTEPAPGVLVPLSGILASRRRKQRKNGEKTSKNGRDMA